MPYRYLVVWKRPLTNEEYRPRESSKPSVQEDASQEHSRWYQSETSRPSEERNNHQQPLLQYHSPAEKHQAPRQNYMSEVFSNSPERQANANLDALFKQDFPSVQIPSLRVAELDEFLKENLQDTIQKSLNKDSLPRERLSSNSESNRSPYPRLHQPDANDKNFQDHSQRNFDDTSSRPLQRPFLKSIDDRNRPSAIGEISQRQPQSDEDENPPPFSNQKILIGYRNKNPEKSFSSQQVNDNNNNYREKFHEHRGLHSDYSNEQNPSSHQATQNNGIPFTAQSPDGQYHEEFNNLRELHAGVSNKNVPISHQTIQDPSERFHQLRELQIELMNGNIPPSLQGVQNLRGGFDHLRELHTGYPHKDVPTSHRTNQNPSNSFPRPSKDLKYREPSHHSPEAHLKYSNENGPVDSRELIQRSKDSYALATALDSNPDSRESSREFSNQSGLSSQQKRNPLFTDSELTAPHQQRDVPPDFSSAKSNLQSESYYPSENFDNGHSRKQGIKPNSPMGEHFQASGHRSQIQPPKTSQISSRLPTEQQRKFLKEHSAKRNNKGHALSSQENVRSVHVERYTNDQRAAKNRTTSARNQSDNLIGMESETEPDSEPAEEAEPLEKDDVFDDDEHDGFLDMGAYTDKKGSFGWYADFPVGRGHDKVSYSSS
ncbi:hypothetical protein NPIL_595961 [Nephila pilipes]|uniref:Uncharacterized protein n=1 Tax=Nephila pilipes TaxID=299642 RepID=A0A8X6QUT8_NEPPI|nr:hypothetical protein NPIL_595961 [Nephila pilipes]